MYCEKIHPSSSSSISSTTVTEEKFFGFLFYQSRRSVKAKGRPKNVSEIPVFNEAEYVEFMKDPTLKADKPCGYSVLNQYRSAILELHAKQRDNGCSNVTKEELMSNRVKRLLNNVKKQKIIVSRKIFGEKLTAEFAPYTTVYEVPRIVFFYLRNIHF